MIRPTCLRARSLLPGLAMLTLLCACDGGIRGTGGVIPPVGIDGGVDGGTDAGIEATTEPGGGADGIASEAPQTDGGADSAGAPTDGTGANMTGGDTGNSGANGDTTDTSPQSTGDTEFSNLLPITNRDMALLNVIHAWPQLEDAVVVVATTAVVPEDGQMGNDTTGMDATLVALPGLSYSDGFSDYLGLSPDTVSLQVLTASRYAQGLFAPPLWRIDRLQLGAGSVSTLLLRRADDGSTTEGWLLPQPAPRSSDAMGSIRLIHAAPVLAMRHPQLLLEFVNADGQGLTETGTGLNYADVSTPYLQLPAGNYDWRLRNAADDRIVFNSLDVTASLRLATGETITLVIRDDPGNLDQAPDILVISDFGESGQLIQVDRFQP